MVPYYKGGVIYVLELSLSQDTKLLFRLEIGGLDLQAVLELTRNAIEKAQAESKNRDSSVEAVVKYVQPAIETVLPLAPTQTKPYVETINGLTPNMQAMLLAVQKSKSGRQAIKDLLKVATAHGFKSEGKIPDQTVRYLWKTMKEKGWAKESPDGKKVLTGVGIEIVQNLLQSPL
jgi:hypothetical protein